jgi:hypothetical protein
MTAAAAAPFAPAPGEWPKRLSDYLHSQHPALMREINDRWVRDLLKLHPVTKGTQRSPEHFILAAVTLLTLTTQARGRILTAGIPDLAEQAGVSASTMVRAGGWLRDVLRALNRRRGYEGMGVNQYTHTADTLRSLASYVKAYNAERKARGLERKRMQDKASLPLCVTSPQVAPVLPTGKGVVGLRQRVADQREQLMRKLGRSEDDCEHGNPPNACAQCRQRRSAAAVF